MTEFGLVRRVRCVKFRPACNRGNCGRDIVIVDTGTEKAPIRTEVSVPCAAVLGTPAELEFAQRAGQVKIPLEGNRVWDRLE